jgi:hypothetical protein
MMATTEMLRSVLRTSRGQPNLKLQSAEQRASLALDLLSLGSRAALGVSFLLSVARAWLRRTPRGLSCLPIRRSSRCLAPSSSEGEVTSTTGKALFHLRFRKLPMAPGMRCRTSFPTLQHFQQRDK